MVNQPRLRQDLLLLTVIVVVNIPAGIVIRLGVLARQVCPGTEVVLGPLALSVCRLGFILFFHSLICTPITD